MKLGTRLLVALLPTVILIMSGYGAWALIEREQTLVPEARQEAHAYATALALAFEYALRDATHENVRQVLNRISQLPTVYGIAVYDADGRLTFASDLLDEAGPAPPAKLAQVLAGADTVLFEREAEGQRLLSMLRAIRGPDGRISGALEVAQPAAFIDAEKARVRHRFLLNTLTLLGGLTLVTLWIVRRVVTRPMAPLAAGARALGRGELGHRIPEPAGGGELAELARELNGMARSLEATRAQVVREAEERVALERRLRESEKMAAIGNLAAGLAHEVAAPLNVISGRAELMLKREPAARDRERHLRVIVQQIGRITRTVRNLLDFARRRELRTEPLELSSVLDGVVEFLEHEIARAGAELTRADAPGLTVMGDRDLLHQVFANLLLNALQAMEGADGPRRLALRSLDPHEQEAAAPAGAWAAVEVEDNGPGIAPDALARIFDPFFTTKAAGTGLGLVVARSIVEEHGGRLEAHNAPGRGAVLRVVLPAVRSLAHV
jgi:two-component system NtrC family sensor kinase